MTENTLDEITILIDFNDCNCKPVDVIHGSIGKPKGNITPVTFNKAKGGRTSLLVFDYTIAEHRPDLVKRLKIACKKDTIDLSISDMINIKDINTDLKSELTYKFKCE